MSWLKRPFVGQAPSVLSSKVPVEKPQHGLQYFEVPVEVSVFRCSDPECSCPGSENLAPGQTGYLYISPEVVEMRKDALTTAQLNAKVAKMGKDKGAVFVFDYGTIYPIFMCKQAAQRRGLDLAVAAVDAERWTTSGLVPLRVTPKCSPQRDVTMLKYPIGIGTMGGAFTELIPAGSMLPHTFSDVFGNAIDGQAALELSLFQRKGAQMIAVGDVIIRDMPPRPKGQLQIRIQIDVDDCHQLHVIADLLDGEPKPALRAGPFSVE